MMDQNSLNQPANNFINTELQHHLQQLLTDLQLDDAPAGGALVVYQAGECIAQASVGMAQIDAAWQPTTLALNFSTGKGVLATLVHILVSQQLLDYDTALANYWPAFAANGKANITLRTVMSHQANLFDISAMDTDNATILDWDQMVAKVAAMSTTIPHSATAYHSAYSALIYGWVLGALIEIVTDMSLADALRYYLTEPLGIADSCYFGVPATQINNVAKLVKNFKTSDKDRPQLGRRRHKPTLKADSIASLQIYQKLSSYGCWQQLVARDKPLAADKPLDTTQINRLYFDHSSIDAHNYKAALMPAQPIDYYNEQTLQAAIPAANGIASAQALATIYAMLANSGSWQGNTLIDSATFKQLSTPQVDGYDAVMPAQMRWRLGYHRLFSICQDKAANDVTERGFGHMGYNGSVAWCDPTRQLSFAFIHNFDVTMLNDIRQFALTEAVLTLVDKQDVINA